MNLNEFIARYYSLKEDGHSRRKIAEITGIGESTIRSWEKSGKLSVGDKLIASGNTIRPHKKRKKLTGKTYVFTSAQNNTFVHDQFLKSVLNYCEHNNAELKIGAFHYNKSGFQNAQDGELWYDPQIIPYILDESAEVFPGLIWCGELNILPTAVNPLSGFHTYCKDASGIIPHVKVQLESIPSPKHDICRMLYTTGAITKSNYIQMKAGQKAEFHHVFGALVAEVGADGDWFVRQLIADSETGEFHDLTTLYTPTGVIEEQRVEAINWGDIHSEKPDPEVFEQSFGQGGMLDQLKPKYQFCHDTMDWTIRNHHSIDSPYFRYKMQVRDNGKDLVENDVKAAADTLLYLQRDWCQTVVVNSNHDQAMLKWLEKADPKEDNVWNAAYYHRCQVRVLEAILNKEEGFSVFEWAARKIQPGLKAFFLKEDESFIICRGQGGGIECGSHGHLGSNGARGGVNSYRVLGTRHNIGHGHSATIRESVYMAGLKGNKEQGYNKGGSSWSNSDILTYSSGKRAIVTWKNGKFKANKR